MNKGHYFAGSFANVPVFCSNKHKLDSVLIARGSYLFDEHKIALWDH